MDLRLNTILNLRETYLDSYPVVQTFSLLLQPLCLAQLCKDITNIVDNSYKPCLKSWWIFSNKIKRCLYTASLLNEPTISFLGKNRKEGLKFYTSTRQLIERAELRKKRRTSELFLSLFNEKVFE